MYDSGERVSLRVVAVPATIVVLVLARARHGRCTVLCKELSKQLLVAHYRGIKLHQETLKVITDAAVCGIDVDSACVPDNRVRHAFEIVEGRLRTPESSERKERDVAPVGAGHSWANGHLSRLLRYVVLIL